MNSKNRHIYEQIRIGFVKTYREREYRKLKKKQNEKQYITGIKDVKKKMKNRERNR